MVLILIGNNLEKEENRGQYSNENTKRFENLFALTNFREVT